jgi:dissimilatory sulfite reductase (desulfoviridin) alpha/beta subunit
MKWAPDAEAAIKNVPFFIRKKVKKKMEAHVREQGKDRVSLADVSALKKQFLSREGMEKQIQGYDISTCFGGDGCPNSANGCARLAADIRQVMEKADILSFLKARVTSGLKFHHEFRICLSDCPNACSRPQIADIGIIGAVSVRTGDEACTGCQSCVKVCPDQAIDLNDMGPVIDPAQCLSCFKCIQACPTGTLQEDVRGFRILLGGRLGRHPRLGMEVPGIHSHDQVLLMVQKCLDFYKAQSNHGERFSHILDSIEQILG